MWFFIRQLFQLLLSPSCGWQDIADESPDPERMQREGLLPLLGCASASELLRYFYERSLGFDVVLARAVVVFGAFFASLYLARLMLDLTLGKCMEGDLNPQRVSIVSICLIGIMAMFEIIKNILPTDLTLLFFLPLLLLVVIYYAVPYLSIKSDSVLNFLSITALATIILPGLLLWCLTLIIS